MTLMLLDNSSVCLERFSWGAMHHPRDGSAAALPAPATCTHEEDEPGVVLERAPLVPAVDRILAAMDREIARRSPRL